MRLRVLQIGMLVGLLAIGIVLWQIKSKWWLAIVLVPVILVTFNYFPKLSPFWKTSYTIFLFVIVVVFSGNILNVISSNVENPPEWDYTSFWLNGRLAVQRLDFYDPQNYRQEADASKLSLHDDFKLEIIDVAFWYPPPSILLFLPLGWFSLQTGLVLWYVFHIGVLVGVIFLLWSLFLRNDGRIGLLVTAALTLMLPGTVQTIQLAQTGLFVLLMMLLFWHNQNSAKAGVFLAVAILIKPLAAVFLLYPLFKRQGRLIAAAVGTLAILSAIVIAIFGLNTFLSYNPLTRLPPIVYTESINQSLLAAILRLTHYDFSSRSPLTQPIFIIAAILLVCLTSWSVYRLPERARSWALALLILLALLVYPATLAHYSVLLLPVFFLLWTQRARLAGGTWGIIGFITLVYGTAGYNNGSLAITGFILCWILLTVITIWNRNNLLADDGVGEALPLASL